MNMTLALPHGENSNIEFRAWPKDIDILTLQAFYQAYEMGGDGHFQNWWDFSAQVRKGHVICVSIEEDDYRSCFGIELMKDEDGPYISFLFYVGRLTKKLVRELVFWLFMFMQHYKQEQHFDGDGRLYLGGRGGWQALVYKMGLTIDPFGFITENQEGFRHGHVGRLQ